MERVRFVFEMVCCSRTAGCGNFVDAATIKNTTGIPSQLALGACDADVVDVASVGR